MGGAKSKLEGEDKALVKNEPTSLSLSKRGYVSVPKEVVKTTSLTSLDLSSNAIAKLKPDLSPLVKLRVLDIQRNSLEDLPAAIAKLTALTDLNLAFNPVREIPQVVSKLPALADLKIGFNGVGKSNAAALIRAQGKKGKALFIVKPALFDPAKSSLPKSLTSLSLPGLGLRTLPDSLANCSRLVVLNVGANSFATVPACVSKLASLTSFSVAKNKIEDLPDALGTLPLTKLKLDSNPLTSLPEDIRSAPADIVCIYLRKRSGLPDPAASKAPSDEPAANVAGADEAGPQAMANGDDAGGVGSAPVRGAGTIEAGSDEADGEDVDALVDRVEEILDADAAAAANNDNEHDDYWALDGGAGEAEGLGEAEAEAEAEEAGEGEAWEFADEDGDESELAEVAAASFASAASGQADDDGESESSFNWAEVASKEEKSGTAEGERAVTPDADTTRELVAYHEHEPTPPPRQQSSSSGVEVSEASRRESAALYALREQPSFVHEARSRDALDDGRKRPTGLFPPRRRLVDEPLPSLALERSFGGGALTSGSPTRPPMRLSPAPERIRIPGEHVLIRTSPSRDPYAPRR
ncbi:small GTP-binding protein, partial [Thecamonas trahens ATCC 50062]